MLPRSPAYLFNSNFYFVLPPLHGYSHKARFFSECQTSILRNFENRFLPFSVASTPSFRHWSPPYVVDHMLVDRQAIFASNFNARGWSSCAFGFLVASLLSLFFSRFCAACDTVHFSFYRLFFSRSHFVKPSRRFFDKLLSLAKRLHRGRRPQ